MNLFSKIGFFASMASKKADQAGDGLAALVVSFDPETASEVEIDAIDQSLNEALRKVATIRDEYEQEQREADAINNRNSRLMTAAESLQGQLDGASGKKKEQIEAALGKVIAELEEIAPEVDRENAEAADAKRYLEEWESSAKMLADKLKSARSNLRKAQRSMERAERDQKRAQERAEESAVLAGIKKESSSLDTALAAMNQRAQKAENETEAMEAKARLLGQGEGNSLEDDPLIAAAMGESKESESSSLSDRLAALKKRKAAA